MKKWRRIFLVLLIFITVLALVLSACGPVDNGNGRNKNGDKEKTSNANKITICHKTGSDKKPYKEITIAKDAVADGHATHVGDIIPAPAGGCLKK